MITCRLHPRALLITVLPSPWSTGFGQIVWQNIAGGNFTNHAHWVGGVVPGITYTAQFLSNATNAVFFTSGVTNGAVLFSAGTTTFDLNANEWRLRGSMTHAVDFQGTGATVVLQNGILTTTNHLGVGTTSAAHSNSFLVLAGALVRTIDFDIRAGQAGSYNILVVTNGGHVISGRSVVIGGTATASNDLLVLSGFGSGLETLTTATGSGNGVIFGSGGHGNRLVIENGGFVSNVVGNVGHAGTNQSALITSGGIWTNTGNFFIGSGGRDHSVTISNNGTLFVRGTVFIGNGGAFNNLKVDSGGMAVASNHFHFGVTGASTNNTVIVSGLGAELHTITLDINVGLKGSSNALLVLDGGIVRAGRHIYVGGAAAGAVASTNNYLLVSGADAQLWAAQNIHFGAVSNALGHRLVVENGARITVGGSVTVGTGSAATNNSIFVGSGGLLEVQAASGNRLQVGTGAGNTISNVGGILQFTSAGPAIDNGGSPTKIGIMGGKISFRAITNADVRVSAPGFVLNSATMSWAGANTFMLNAASNITAGQTYTFQAGNPTNFAHLAMVNGHTAYRGGNITIGTTGSMLLSNTRASITGLFTNHGVFTSINSVGTFHSAVHNAGAWITDPTTNVFLADYVVANIGSIRMDAGDVFILKADFVNLSSQSNTYNTTQGKFLFDGSGVTQRFFTAGLDLGPGGIYPGAPQHRLIGGFPLNNFVLGTLEISNFSTVIVTDAFVLDGKRAGLYVENLRLGPQSLLVISNNVSMYFFNSNNWNFINLLLLGDAELHQLIIPEANTLLLMLLGGWMLARVWRQNKVNTGKLLIPDVPQIEK